MTDNALINLDVLKPEAVFADADSINHLIDRVENQVRAMELPGVEHEDDRAELKSLAYKITRSKTALDEVGKNFVAALKKKTGEIDGLRRIAKGRLEKLHDEIRKPLTDWEDKEKARVDAHETTIAEILKLSEFSVLSDSSDALTTRLNVIGELAEHDFEEFAAKAHVAIEDARARLTEALKIATKREAEAAELERLRQEKAERDQREREARIAKEAADAARAEAEGRAAEHLADVLKQKDAETVAKLRELVDDRAAATTRPTSMASAGGLAKSHRSKINNAAADALRKFGGLSLPEARAVITAIAKGQIPAVTITY